ncbi:Glycosyltransferases, probably involved in cell wall biogenesis [Methylobacterium sp. 174MFSha1.1]|uniref:glycosyltransferase family 2 protein n=1 Tax=Methylobacterium sp. 174MFSha1.1 TaxID=1502749 RepID=UPI0008E186C3|nr:glycosyltransferase [Methylobacterium sp. 174MFSha1.1]SFU75748.1 Glycosyltransferases, probably involved in cell wall biogenesis [Methylobacterium sp. 174MFSha1.1]
MTPDSSPPTVSVLIPCFNQGRFLYEAALSATLATAARLEIVIVDDGSTDPGTRRQLAEVEAVAADARCAVRVIRQANQGLSAARNAALDAARGRYLQFLDADDLLAPGKIDLQMRHCAVTGIDVSVSDFIEADAALEQFERHPGLVSGRGFGLEAFVLHWERGLSIPIHCGLFRASAVAGLRFDTTVSAKEDWIFWTTLAAAGRRIAYLGGAGAIYRRHGDSMCRAQRHLGRDWLTAATRVDVLSGGRFPDALASACRWFLTAYAPIASRPEPPADKPEAALPRPLPPPGRRARVAAPRVSVVVPVFNHAEHLPGCIASILGQDLDSLEIVLVDDASTDPRIPAFLAETAREQAAVTLLSHPENRGPAAALNTALTACRGELVAFVDCDDALEPNALSRLAGLIDREDGDYAFSDRWDIDPTGTVLRLARYGGYDDDRFEGRFRQDILNGMVASHLKLIRRESLTRAGAFDERWCGVQDWELVLRMAADHRFTYCPEPLYRYRVHDGSITRRAWRQQFQRSNAVRRLHAPALLRGAGEVSRRERLHPADLTSCVAIMRRWERSDLSVDLRGPPLSHRDLWFLREFNSYFDEIITDRPDLFASLIGFVWSPSILRQA